MVLRLRDTAAYRACERELPVEQSQYSECVYICARANHLSYLQRAVQVQGAVKWRDKDRFDSYMLMMLYSQSTRSTCSHHPSAIKYWEKGEKAMERKLR